MSKYIWEVDMRARMIAAPGKKLIIFDAAQIEPRIQHWLVTKLFPGTKIAEVALDTLEKIRNGMSIYEVHARKVGGWTGGCLKDEDPDEYFDRKQQVLGLGYGCGALKYYKKCLELGMNITFEKAQQDHREFKTKERGIVAIWDHLNELAFKSAREWDRWVFDGRVGPRPEDLEIELPDGNKLVYSDLSVVKASARNNQYKAIQKKKKDGPQVEAKYASVSAKYLRGEDRDRDRPGPQPAHYTWIYGALIFEHIVQRIAREIMGDMILACDDRGWTGLFTVHDEGVLEVDEDVSLQEVLDTVSVTPEWAQGLPIEAEAKESHCYTK